jgi:crotonobetainyl-CoA:carnitine CoA-transferase CaiB-like acyl-CoA transferase
MPAELRAVSSAHNAWNCSGLYNAVNLNKRAITLDLSQPDGLRLLRELIPLADIVAENFTPRVMGNLGLDYDSLTALRPDLILLSLSAYGASGPWRDVPGIGGTIEPTSGISGLTGYSDGPPMNSGSMLPDAVAGYYGLAALMTALHQRDRTGEGQHIDLSMMEANFTAVGDASLEFAATGRVRGRRGNRHPSHAPHGVYATLDGEWLALAAESDAQWLAMCTTAGRADWASDSRFAERESRKTHEDELDALIGPWLARENAAALEGRLLAAGVPAAVVADSHSVAQDPALRAREAVVDVEHPEMGSWPHPGFPFRFASGPLSIERAAPTLGQHTPEVLRELLGVDEDEYARLVREGISGETPPD